MTVAVATFQDFYRKSVFETKYLFTLNDMDLRLMVRQRCPPSPLQHQFYAILRYVTMRCLQQGRWRLSQYIVPLACALAITTAFASRRGRARSY